MPTAHFNSVVGALVGVHAVVIAAIPLWDWSRSHDGPLFLVVFLVLLVVGASSSATVVWAVFYVVTLAITNRVGTTELGNYLLWAPSLLVVIDGTIMLSRAAMTPRETTRWLQGLFFRPISLISLALTSLGLALIWHSPVNGFILYLFGAGVGAVILGSEYRFENKRRHVDSDGRRRLAE